MHIKLTTKGNTVNIKKLTIYLILATANFTIHSTPEVKNQTPVQECEQLLADAKHWRTFTTHSLLLLVQIAGSVGGACLSYGAETIVDCVANITPTPAGSIGNHAELSRLKYRYLGQFFLAWSFCTWKAKQFETRASSLATRLTTSDRVECAKVIADLEAITAKDTQVYSWLHLPLNPLTPIVNYQRIIGHFNTQVRMTQALKKVYATAQARIKELDIA
jgi:hypothetical protein